MANPNVDIWGDPDTWVNDYIIRSNDFPQYKAGKPKNAAFRSLMNGNTQNKTPYPMPIDKTICPCGQDSTVSCFGKIYTMSGDSVDDNNNFTPETTIEFETPVNWCFSSGGPATQGWEIRNGFNSVYPPPSTWRWSPNTGELNTNENRNAGVMPFVFYQLKSLLLSIQVLTVDGHATAEYGSTPTNSIGWKTLAEWKSSYSNKSIYSIRFNINWCTSANDSNIAYSGDTQTLGSFDTLQVSLLDGVNLMSGSSELYYDYATYQMVAKNNCFYLTNVYTSPRYTPTRRYYVLSADKFENAVLHSTRGSNNNYWSNVWYEIPYSENNYASIMKMVACFGCPFTDTNKLSFRLDYTDSELCLPVIDSDGITHGEYTRGTANTTNDLYNADSVRDKNYDPSKPTDPNTYSNTSHFYNVAVGGGNKRYSLSGFLGVDSLMSDLWALTTTLSADDFSNFDNKIRADMLVSDPIDSIVSLMCFPFIVPHNEKSEHIKLGKYDLQTQGHAVTAGSYTINFSGKQLFPRFGDCYLDYEPYTNYEVYVPFCGTIPLRAADILGHTLNIKLVVDLYTGSCTGFVLADDLVIETIVGTIAITIPVTGIDSATINSQIVNANLNYKSALYSSSTAIGSTLSMGGFFSALTNPADTVNKIAQTQIAEDKAKYDLTHIPTQPHMIGSSSPVIGWCCDTIARVLIYYPTGDVINDSKPPSLIADKIAEFGKMQGFATVDTGKVGDYHGFTMGTLRTEGIACTESERQCLKALFATGVILP